MVVKVFVGGLHTEVSVHEHWRLQMKDTRMEVVVYNGQLY